MNLDDLWDIALGLFVMAVALAPWAVAALVGWPV